MTTRQEESQTGAPDPRFGPLADETRRRVVRLLRGRSDPVPEEELCKRLAGAESDPQSGENAAERTDTLGIRLRHIHLPKLAEGGLVEWDREERSVGATDHAVYDARPREPIGTADRGSMASAPAARRYREILDVVEAEDGSITLSELARELSPKGTGPGRAERSVDEIRIRLHHQQLPRLEDEGLVEYGPDGEITVAEGGRRSERCP